jgi:PRC-barrel domain
MYGKMLAVAAIGAMISTAAFAEDSNKTQNASAKGQWQASKLIHMNVYNGQNEKIGDIKELLLTKSGKIDAVAIGVGGFVGVGEHDIAVKFEQLKWAQEPVSNTKSSNNQPAATTGSNQADKPSQKVERNYPDHAVLNVTKDQLKSMPQFDYSK